MNADGKVVNESKCTKIIRRMGLEQEFVEQAVAGISILLYR